VAKGTDNPFDNDLFEPFELEDEPPVPESGPTHRPASPAPAEPQTADPGVPTVRCPSCGTNNPAHNRHCEECGARLGKGPLPVAPPPMSRSTPGGRALGVLGGVVVLVALIALFMNLWGGEDTVAPDDQTSTSLASDETVAQVAIAPASVDASSELDGYEASQLIDGDISTYWNDQSARGTDAQLDFVFAQPVALSEMELTNIQERDPFRQNYRIKDIEITVDDLELQLTFTVPDSRDPYRITLDTLHTTRLTLRVLSTYPGEPVGDSPAFDELALAEVRFFGTFAE
jgi:hypothetical protein